MDLLSSLGRTLGFSFAAGINLYATVAILGLASLRLGRRCRRSTGCSTTTGSSAARSRFTSIEFVADKIPWVDSVWDAVHTVIRPFGGALIAVATLGDASPATKTMVGLLGGALAASTHLSKAGTRAHGERQPGAVHELDPEHRRGRFVVGLGAPGAEVSGGGRDRRDRAALR